MLDAGGGFFGAGQSVSGRGRITGYANAGTGWAGRHDALRQCGSTLAVVFLTGHGDVPMAVEQMKRGAVDFLQKPVSVKPLQARWSVR
ncbi:Transcriptional regulatory protein fixJ [Salmonella enterica subsp. enterica]|nr:Transcriptional regulatory protein fixJ [Salmonella enterica subsp. enterica]